MADTFSCSPNKQIELSQQQEDSEEILQPEDPPEENPFDLNIFAANFNALRIMSGMAGLSYSS